MNRFGDDASSVESDESPPKQSLKLPSMYSPESKASVAASPGSRSSNEDGVSNADDGDIDIEIKGLSSDLQEIFGLVDSYEPVDLEPDAPLRCFMPSYVPAIGEVDPMVKIPRPDGVPDGLGTAILDEPIPSLQSNPAIIELQLRNRAKNGSGRNAPVHSLTGDPKESSEEINQWIQSVEQVHASQPSSEVRRYQNKMPRAQDLMRAWPKEMEDQLRNGEVEFPNADIELSVGEYARVVCSLLGIPVHEGRAIESVHVLFSLFLETQGSAETDVF